MINQLYSSIYLGDSSVQRIYQGDDLIYAAERPDILLSYIANGPDNGVANPDVYFTTGVAPQLYTKTEFKFEASTIADGRIFGCGNAADASTMYNFNMYGSGPTSTGGNKTSLKFFYRGGAISTPFTPEANTPYTVTLFGTYSGDTASEINIIVNGTKYTRSISVSSNITDAASAWIFRWNGNQNPSRPSGIKFYYLKMWNDNKLVRFFVPVLHWLNGQYVPCFYDKVTDIYIYNLGTDTPTYKISGDYLLDYLGAQPETAIPNNTYQVTRYETGLIANNQMAVDTRFRVIYGRENFIYGSATSRDTTPAWQSYSLGTAGNLTRLDSNHGGTTTSSVTFALTSDASAITNVHTFSTYFDDQARAIAYLDSSLFTKTVQSVNFSSETIQLLTRHGYDTAPVAGSGARIYYINFTNSNIPAKTYVPVFHNNQASFLDLNSGTYIYNIGTDVPYYQFKR